MRAPDRQLPGGLAVFDSEAIMPYAGNAGRLQSRVDARGENARSPGLVLAAFAITALKIVVGFTTGRWEFSPRPLTPDST